MNEVSVFEAIEIAWRRKLLIVALVLVATVSAYLISSAQPRIYQADTTIVFPGSRPNIAIPGLEALTQALGRVPTLPGALDAVPSSTTVLPLVLKSRTLAERVVQSCDLLTEYRTGSIQGAANQLKQDTTISQDPGGGIVIAVKAKKPALAAEIANGYVRELQAVAKDQIDLSLNRRSRAFIDDQLRLVTAKLHLAEARLQAYQETHQIVALPDEARAVVQQVANLEQDRVATQVTLSATNARLAEVRRQIEAQTSKPLEDLPAHSPVIQGWREKLVKLNADLTLARQEFTDDNPAIQSLQAQIGETKHQLNLELGRVRGSLRSGLAPELTSHEVEKLAQEAHAEAVERALKSARRDSEQLPAESIQLARLERERAVQDGLYSYFRSEGEKLRLVEAREGPAFVVLDAAVVPEGPIWPRPKLITILAAVLSFVVGMTLAFFAEYAERARYARGKRAYLAQEEISPPAHAVHRG